MTPRLGAIRDEPILFAHRGGKAHEAENTIRCFRLGLKLGANGLESDVWVTKDNQPALIHDDAFGPRLRRRKVADTLAQDLPEDVPTIADFYAAVGTDFEFSIDIKTPDAIECTVNALRAASEQYNDDVVAKTWLCHPDLELLTSWRQRWSDLRLVHSTRLAKVPGGPERHGSLLFERQIDAVNFRQPDWSGGLTALYHRFGIYCFGWDAQLERVVAELLDMGCDGVFSDHVDRMVAARNRIYG